MNFFFYHTVGNTPSKYYVLPLCARWMAVSIFSRYLLKVLLYIPLFILNDISYLKYLKIINSNGHSLLSGIAVLLDYRILNNVCKMISLLVLLPQNHMNINQSVFYTWLRIGICVYTLVSKWEFEYRTHSHVKARFVIFYNVQVRVFFNAYFV